MEDRQHAHSTGRSVMGREDVSLTYTGIMKQGDKRVVKIRFTRNGEKDFAECILPGGTIEKSQGFSEKELAYDWRRFRRTASSTQTGSAGLLRFFESIKKRLYFVGAGRFFVMELS